MMDEMSLVFNTAYRSFRGFLFQAEVGTFESMSPNTFKASILLTPGPVPVPPEVLEILAQPMEHHRTPNFEKVFTRVRQNLKTVFGTNQPVFIHTSTGSGAMESALVNTLNRGDEVLSIVSGKFGERWADMAETFGLKVHRLNVKWGESVDPREVEKFLSSNKSIRAVLTQACETSTGVLHPIAAIATMTSKTDALLIVDGITAVGALPLPMDEIGIDVLIAGSQKAFMLPTGISFIALSQRAWVRAQTANLPRYYFDLRKEKDANDKGESYYSTAVAHIKALDVVLQWVEKRGTEFLYNRIGSLAKATREAGHAMGLASFAKNPSTSLTALVLPEGIDGQKLRASIESKYGVTLMGGQDQLKGKILRIGHMGYISNEEMIICFESIARALNEQKPKTVSDSQLKDAIEILKRELS